MKSDWLAASSFEQTQDLIAAITTLSIQAKLTLAGRSDIAGLGRYKMPVSGCSTSFSAFSAYWKVSKQAGIALWSGPTLISEPSRHVTCRKRSVGRNAPP